VNFLVNALGVPLRSSDASLVENAPSSNAKPHKRQGSASWDIRSNPMHCMATDKSLADFFIVS
jgi:hypothetical protein